METSQNSKTILITVAAIFLVLLALAAFFLISRNQTPAPSTQNSTTTPTTTPPSPTSLITTAAKFSGAMGHWTGSWQNTTYGSTGSVSADFAISGTTLQVTLDINGSVFGGSDPAPFTITDDLLQDKLNLVLPTNSVLGQLTSSSFNPDTGAFSIVTQPTVSGISEFSQRGTLTLDGGPKINGTYTVTFTNGTVANGVITLTK